MPRTKSDQKRYQSASDVPKTASNEIGAIFCQPGARGRRKHSLDDSTIWDLQHHLAHVFALRNQPECRLELANGHSHDGFDRSEDAAVEECNNLARHFVEVILTLVAERKEVY